ncbi:hypothetical protein ACVIHH_006270 [Bradyrhizobium sp. USDA 4518]
MGAIRPLTLILGCPGSDKMTRARCRKPAFERPEVHRGPPDQVSDLALSRAALAGARLELGSHGTVQPLAAIKDYSVTNVLTQLIAAASDNSFNCARSRRSKSASAHRRRTRHHCSDGERAENDTTTTKRPVTPSKRWRIGFSRRCVAVSRPITSGSRRTIRRLQRDESDSPFSLPGRNAATHNRGNDQDGLPSRRARSAMSGGK